MRTFIFYTMLAIVITGSEAWRAQQRANALERKLAIALNENAVLSKQARYSAVGQLVVNWDDARMNRITELKAQLNKCERDPSYKWLERHPYDGWFEPVAPPRKAQ
jgi:hypothetical protein